MDLTPRERLLVALDLMEAGIALMRQNLKRRNPDASPEELDRRLDAWLAASPPPELVEPSFRIRPIAP